MYGDIAGAHFDHKIAQRGLASYRKKGPGSTTRLLRDFLLETGRIEGVLLDVGAGIGGLTFELLERGVARGIAVDASAANLAAAAEEASRRGRPGVVQLLQGDFLDIASSVTCAKASI
jgi:predicted RNA methylase